MSRGPQFGRRAGAFALILRRRQYARWLPSAISALAIAAMLLGFSLKAGADQPQSVVGHIQGSDASVETAVAGSDTISSAEAGVDVANGSIITVHSGQAHMTLKSGGDVDICGPAKLTLLQAGTAITLALNFGRVRVQLPASADLRIFTPTIIATPLDINGAARDVTAGLDLDDSLCVTAGSGALLLENQFSGEKLVVPQGGEFTLARGQLVPVAGEAGACQCVSLQTKEVIPPPEPSLGLTAPAHVDPPTAAAATANGPLPTDTAPKSSVEYSVLAHANQVRPNAPPPKPAPPAPPATEIPDYKVVLPPLTFSASSPQPPPDPTPDMILLIRTVHIEPDWEFSGHVDPPPMDAKAKQAKTEATSNPGPAAPQAPPKKKEGFWAKMKKFLSGSSS